MVMCNHQQTFWDEGLKKVEKCSDNCNGSLGPYMRGICEKWCNEYMHCLETKDIIHTTTTTPAPVIIQKDTYRDYLIGLVAGVCLVLFIIGIVLLFKFLRVKYHMDVDIKCVKRNESVERSHTKCQEKLPDPNQDQDYDAIDVPPHRGGSATDAFSNNGYDGTPQINMDMHHRSHGEYHSCPGLGNPPPPPVVADRYHVPVHHSTPHGTPVVPRSQGTSTGHHEGGRDFRPGQYQGYSGAQELLRVAQHNQQQRSGSPVYHDETHHGRSDSGVVLGGYSPINGHYESGYNSEANNNSEIVNPVQSAVQIDVQNAASQQTAISHTKPVVRLEPSPSMESYHI